MCAETLRGVGCGGNCGESVRGAPGGEGYSSLEFAQPHERKCRQYSQHRLPIVSCQPPARLRVPLRSGLVVVCLESACLCPLRALCLSRTCTPAVYVSCSQ